LYQSCAATPRQALFSFRIICPACARIGIGQRRRALLGRDGRELLGEVGTDFSFGLHLAESRGDFTRNLKRLAVIDPAFQMVEDD